MSTDPRQLTVLVVEDEFILRLDMVEALGKFGFQTIEAPTADAALRLVTVHAPDALFTDIVMPGTVDGLRLAQLMRDQRPDLFIAIISGNDRPEALPKNTEYVRKPWSHDELSGLTERVRVWCDGLPSAT